MRVLIIEDEQLALDYITGMLDQIDFDLTVAGTADSVKNGIRWLLKHDEPDLILTDIDLGDGLCFEIFEVVQVTCPVIFITAYDEYAIQAFQVYSIDYLLKPVDQDALKRAFDKLIKMREDQQSNSVQIQNAARMVSGPYKERFIIRIGDHLIPVPIQRIMYFGSWNKMTYLITEEGRKYPLDYSLNDLVDVLDPVAFFRINRKYIIHYRAINDILAFSNSRLKLNLDKSQEEDIIVARERVSSFKEWLDR